MTRALTAADLMSIWERGRRSHPVDRALLMLQGACPDLSDDALARLTIGERDRLLLAARACTLGERLDASASCPQCATALEFSVAANDLHQAEEASGARALIELEEGGFHIALRPPDSGDLAAISAAADVTTARQQLLRLCVVAARRDGESVDVSQLPSAVLARIPAILEQCDPLAEIVLDMHCAACGYSWSLLFDIAAFFWSEIEALAGRLLAEVDALARAYGWHEADILAMDGTRRAAYLGMVT